MPPSRQSSLTLVSPPSLRKLASQFEITLVDMGATPPPAMYKAAFEEAKARWEAIIVGDLSDYASILNYGYLDWFDGAYQSLCKNKVYTQSRADFLFFFLGIL
jgi:hypothetical protein